jgi:hypothetical protein
MKNVSDKIDDSKNPHKLRQQVNKSEYRYKQKEIEIIDTFQVFLILYIGAHIKFWTIETLIPLTLGHSFV